MEALLIDDHATVRDGARAVLRQAVPGRAMLQAADLATSLDTARDHADIELAILDLAMPFLSGIPALAAFITKAHLSSGTSMREEPVFSVSFG